MKQAQVRRAGAEPVLVEVPGPVAGPGQVLADVVAVGVHPLVRAVAGNRHYGASGDWPMTPGVDAVARVDGVLSYIGGFHGPGTLAEQVVIPAGSQLPLPAGADPTVVAAAINPGMPSWMALQERRADVGDLGLVVVLGATGVAGILAVQSAFVLGASRVLAVGRDAGRLARAADAGAEVVALGGEAGDDADALRAALGEATPTLVLDFVWGPVAEAMFTAMQRRSLAEASGGTVHVEIGCAAGETARVPASLLRSRPYTIHGSGGGSVSLERRAALMPGFMARLADGSIVAPVCTFPLAAVVQAWTATGDARAVVLPQG